MSICPAYVSKYKSNSEKQTILSMISNREKQWHYLAVKKISALFRGITSKEKDNGDFYCLNCLNYFTSNSKLESHKRAYER